MRCELEDGDDTDRAVLGKDFPQTYEHHVNQHLRDFALPDGQINNHHRDNDGPQHSDRSDNGPRLKYLALLVLLILTICTAVAIGIATPRMENDRKITSATRSILPTPALVTAEPLLTSAPTAGTEVNATPTLSSTSSPTCSVTSDATTSRCVCDKGTTYDIGTLTASNTEILLFCALPSLAVIIETRPMTSVMTMTTFVTSSQTPDPSSRSSSSSSSIAPLPGDEPHRPISTPSSSLSSTPMPANFGPLKTLLPIAGFCGIKGQSCGVKIKREDVDEGRGRVKEESWKSVDG